MNQCKPAVYTIAINNHAGIVYINNYYSRWRASPGKIPNPNGIKIVGSRFNDCGTLTAQGYTTVSPEKALCKGQSVVLLLFVTEEKGQNSSQESSDVQCMLRAI